MITDNSAPEGGGVRDSGDSMLGNCIISRNSATRGGGYAGVSRPSHLINCTLADNEAPVASGAYLASGAYVVWLFERTVISGGLVGEAVRCDGTASAMFFCTNVFGNAGGDWVDCIMGQQSLAGNMNVDPMFCQAGIDWHLCSDSPCAPPQTGACGLIGALPVGCPDCGAQALEPSTWGQIKHELSRRRLRQVAVDGK
jgi:hypothetical protein